VTVFPVAFFEITRVGQNRILTPYLTVCMVKFLFKMPYIPGINVCMYAWFWPTLEITDTDFQEQVRVKITESLDMCAWRPSLVKRWLLSRMPWKI